MVLGVVEKGVLLRVVVWGLGVLGWWRCTPQWKLCLLQEIKSFRLLKYSKGFWVRMWRPRLTILCKIICPSKPPIPAPASPTEEERMERLAALLRKQKNVVKKVEGSKERVEKAKARVAEEEGKLAADEK